MNEQSSASNEQTHKILFTQLVVMLTTTAMQQMGKLVNPATQKAETDLQGASATIDLLDMLHGKTRGNLDKDEEKLMNEALTSLRMTFVETTNAPATDKVEPSAPAGSEADEQDAPPEETAREEVESSDSPPSNDEDKQPRFQKKYD